MSARFLQLCFIFAASWMEISDAAAQQPTPFLHFRPRDHALGDVHPYFHEGECFLYYLKPGKYESALVCSRDWLHWTDAPLTHTPVSEGDWMSPYYVLGVFCDAEAGVYRSFYGHKDGRMASSVSADLREWSCAPQAFHVPPADYYQRRRDPYVFWIPEMKQYGCVMTTWIKGRPKEKAGAVSLALSPDLKQWKDQGPILDPGNIGEPECPQMFPLGKHWYLMASIYDRAVGAPVYWTSESPLGLWGKAPAGQLDGKDLCAAQIAFDGKVPVLFGWVPQAPARPGKQTWGGHLALPREIYETADGVLVTRLPQKLSDAFASLPWQQCEVPDLAAKAQVIEGRWTKLAAEFILRLIGDATELRLKIEPLGEVVLGPSRLAMLDAAGESWSELPVRLPLNQLMTVKLFVDRDIVELFVDDRYSLVARVPAKPGQLGFSLEAMKPGASISGLRVSEWSTAP